MAASKLMTLSKVAKIRAISRLAANRETIGALTDPASGIDGDTGDLCSG
jgi:hypothetical protein